MKNRTIIRTIIIILVLVCTVFAGRLYIKRNYVNKTYRLDPLKYRLELLECEYKMESIAENIQDDIYGYYKNHTEYRDYYRKIVKDLKTDTLIVDFINTILPYYDLTYENTTIKFEARAEEISDITYAYKANLSLNDRLKIVEFQIKAIKEK